MTAELVPCELGGLLVAEEETHSVIYPTAELLDGVRGGLSKRNLRTLRAESAPAAAREQLEELLGECRPLEQPLEGLGLGKERRERASCSYRQLAVSAPILRRRVALAEVGLERPPQRRPVRAQERDPISQVVPRRGKVRECRGILVGQRVAVRSGRQEEELSKEAIFDRTRSKVLACRRTRSSRALGDERKTLHSLGGRRRKSSVASSSLDADGSSRRTSAARRRSAALLSGSVDAIRSTSAKNWSG